jgi:putative transposase
MKLSEVGAINLVKILKKIIKKKQRKVTDKWHLDEMTMKVNGEYFILWRAVD